MTVRDSGQRSTVVMEDINGQVENDNKEIEKQRPLQKKYSARKAPLKNILLR